MPFKFTLRLGSSRNKKEIYENGPDLSGGGAYRNHREEFLERSSWSEPPTKLTPSMVKLPPPSASKDAMKTSKSTIDLANSYKLPAHLVKSTPDISTDPRGGTSDNTDSSALHHNAKANKDVQRDSKKQEKEKKESEKKRIADQKKREKAAAQEQAKQDKLRIQRDRQIAQQQARDVKMRKEQEQRKKKGPAPPVSTSQGPTQQASNSQARIPQAPPPQGSTPRQQSSTNTLESSISRSSGPPPYADLPNLSEPNKKDATGNTSFAKPIEESSWDMISEHRHQISKTVASGASTKQMMLDLQFSFDKAQIDANNRNISDV